MHENYMRMALAEAAEGRGLVEPNPQVGAVIVRDGKIVAAGRHVRFGGPHAEVQAIDRAGGDSKGSTLYVNLEPCAHHGKTPPCVDAIIEAGITEVISAMRDPNPLTSGKGYERLAAARVSVVDGILEEEARRLNAPYVKLITEGAPYVTAKWAMSLDGKIATAKGESRWISCEESRRRVHELRGLMDAVLVGIGTVLADDPLLTARGQGPRAPVRIVADSRGRTPLDCRLLKTLGEGEILVAAASGAPQAGIDRLRSAGANVVVTSTPGRVDIRELLAHLGGMQMTNLLVEGGGTILGAFFEAALIDAVKVFISPKILGGANAPGPVGGGGVDLVEEALSLREMTVERIGGDILIQGLTERS